MINESLCKAAQILGELMNEDCFNFDDVYNLNFEERKTYLRDWIWCFFASGESCLGGEIQRVYNDCKATGKNIDKFFENEELVADIIFLMDEDIWDEFMIEISTKD